MNDGKTGSQKLGRGLSALLGSPTETDTDAARAPLLVPVEFLRPSRFQPRRIFPEEEINGLADSIRERGILQPILVRRDSDADDKYEIVAGERRWRAAQLAHLHEVPVIVKELSDDGMLEVALVENVQRQNLGPLEEAEAYRRLIDEFSHTQEKLARIVGKSRSHIANTLRLLNLPDKVKQMVDAGTLTAGHARAILNAADPENLAIKAAKRGLNVRQIERLVRREKSPPARVVNTFAQDPDTLALERGLSNLLGLTVTISFDGEGGTLTIRYAKLEQLDDVIQRLGHTAAPGPPARRPARWNETT
jgi:ParB family chromosome partitioning protein